jgi:hypothetical protein
MRDRRGPSHQRGEPYGTPAGADEIEYQSGELILKAFVTPDPGDGREHPAVLFLHGSFAFGGDDWDMPQPYRDAGYEAVEVSGDHFSSVPEAIRLSIEFFKLHDRLP